MKARYGTFSADSNLSKLRHGVLDSITGREYDTVTLYIAEQLAALLNEPSDCRFNCRARREADYLQGWKDRDRNCPIPEAGKRCAKRYVAGEPSGLKDARPLGAR